MKEIINKINLGEHVKISKVYLQEYLFNVYKYCIVKEPYSELLNSYVSENGNDFKFIKALKVYLSNMGTPPVDIIESKDYIEIKPAILGPKTDLEPNFKGNAL